MLLKTKLNTRFEVRMEQHKAEWDRPFPVSIPVQGSMHPRLQSALLAARAHC